MRDRAGLATSSSAFGAFLGGMLFSLVGGGTFTLGWSLTSFIAAVVGALILLFIIRMVRGA
jgi:uncharacterized membrane protein YeaQ/YmgE (transglycosylase-associated protein family)